MKKAITDYIEYLSNNGLRISLHGEGILPHLDFFAQYNSHECVYCMYVKSSAECWRRCRECQKKAEKRLSEVGAFFGSCYAGVGEFVFPITAFDGIVGMISVGGFLGSPEKRAAFSQKYGFLEDKLSSLAKRELIHEIPPFDYIRTLIMPLCAMLTVLIEKNGFRGGGAGLYGKILSIIHTCYTRKLTIAEIAGECHYSPAYVTRVFKEKSGMTVNAYISKIRMEKARELLVNSEMSLEDVAASVGFSDTNYFIASFSACYGKPPKRFKKDNSYLQNNG